MTWYEIVALFFFIGCLFVGFGFLVYFEYKRNKAYVNMLLHQKGYYYWGSLLYQHKVGEFEKKEVE